MTHLASQAGMFLVRSAVSCSVLSWLLKCFTIVLLHFAFMLCPKEASSGFHSTGDVIFRRMHSAHCTVHKALQLSVRSWERHMPHRSRTVEESFWEWPEVMVTLLFAQLDIRQDSAFATRQRYLKTAFKREPDTDKDTRNTCINLSRIQTLG